MNTVLESRTQTTIIGPDQPFVMIGERINPTGRKKLGPEMAAGDFARVMRDAEAQVAAGAQVLDINAGYPLGDEVEMLVAATRAVTSVVEAPLCFDSSVVDALAAALAAYDGKALVNSVTGEDARLEIVLPLVKKHGAAVIGMANDEAGVSNDPAERLRVARKIVQRAQDHGIPPQDVIIDPLLLAVSADPSAPRVTLETIRLIRDELGVNMSFGAGNVSFGLPDRGPVGAAYLAMAIEAGLTCAIMDPTNPLLQQAVLAADVLLGRDEDAFAWIRAYRQRQKALAPA
ncbi:MAG: dihydropteroate synthase [Anaerolineae bacterium]